MNASLCLPLVLIGLGAGPLSQWLYAAMRQAGLAVELLETRHVRDAFKGMPVKSGRNDARGIAQLVRLGWSDRCIASRWRAKGAGVLTARKLIQTKLRDVENSVRGSGAPLPIRFRPKVAKRDHRSAQNG
ncbi:hypothetical protein NKH16_23760 [Mesorhizobium sp. M1307]|uniref:hypothetical protein n=1 Tax=Mesorhizobium sp. M1307 TaxID=2957079 RepID=UPI00333B301E